MINTSSTLERFSCRVELIHARISDLPTKYAESIIPIFVFTSDPTLLRLFSNLERRERSFQFKFPNPNLYPLLIFRIRVLLMGLLIRLLHKSPIPNFLFGPYKLNNQMGHTVINDLTLSTHSQAIKSFLVLFIIIIVN